MDRAVFGLVFAVVGMLLLVPLSVLLVVPRSSVSYTVTVDSPQVTPVLVLNRLLIVFQEDVDCQVLNADDRDDCLDGLYVNKQRVRTILSREGMSIIEQQDTQQFLVSTPAQTYQELLDLTERVKMLPYVRKVEWVYQ